MNLRIVGVIMLPLIIATYQLIRRNYHYAYGGFIAAVVLLPVLHWLEGIPLSPVTMYIAIIVFLLLTALELLYIRLKRKGRGRER